MPTVSNEIIADLTDHIRKFGGHFSAWCVGIAHDGHNPVFEAHQLEDTDDDLIYREAYTAASARTVRDHFVAQGTSPSGNGDSGPDGKLVYVYRKASP